MTGVETELKWALDAAAHAALSDRLSGLLGPAELLAQENRFYDGADGRLRAARRSVRLRRENARVILTCKAAGRVDALGTHRHDEWERELPAAAWDGDPADLAALLPPPWREALADAALALLGGFANERRQWRDGVHLLCLDRTDLGGRIDHELEIETGEPAAAHARWTGLLAAWGIAWTPQLLTKLQRWVDLPRGGPGATTGWAGAKAR